jgi:hypothetical protein
MRPLSDDKLYLFLKFHDGVIKHSHMPYLRNLVALDFLIDKIHVSYGDAELVLDWMINEGLIAFNQFGAFPGTIITEKGYVKLAELTQKYQELPPEKEASDDEKQLSKSIKIIWGPHHRLDGKDSDTIHGDLFNFSEENIYRFLKFNDGVAQRQGSPYLREMVAESFLMDELGFSFEKTDLFLHHLEHLEIIEYSQYGAFPGTGLTTKGQSLLKTLRQKFETATDPR